MTKIREYFARDKVFIDLLFGTKPKFLGQKITLR
jgi:SanA protein